MNETIIRLRIKFAKQGPLRYAGHLDLHRLWERTIRRASLPLVYSQGFNPQPKIQLASALPLGCASRAELVDIWLEDDPSNSHLPEIQARLQQAAPSGLTLLEIEQVDLRGPALQTLVCSAEYEVTLIEQPDASSLTQSLSAIIRAESLPRQRRNKSYDLRPLIEELHAIEPDAKGRPRLFMRLSAREGATGRADEVLDQLSIQLEDAYIERTRLLFSQ